MAACARRRTEGNLRMSWVRVSAVVVSALTLCLANPALKADDGNDNIPTHVTVAFGTGNNNSQVGNTPNHHILPPDIKVRISKAQRLNGDVVIVPATVNFIVSGFHWPWVYRPGVTLDTVKANIPAAGLFVNYDVGVFAKGVFPGTPPTFADRGAVAISGDMNRTDSFGFLLPGRYL